MIENELVSIVLKIKDASVLSEARNKAIEKASEIVGSIPIEIISIEILVDDEGILFEVKMNNFKKISKQNLGLSQINNLNENTHLEINPTESPLGSKFIPWDFEQIPELKEAFLKFQKSEE